MNELFSSPFFGLLLSVAAYGIGVKIQKKTGLVICNALVIAAILIIIVMKVFNISYDTYYEGGGLVYMMLGPVTACMAMGIYNKRDLLKKNLLPVLLGCIVGMLTSIVSVTVMGRLFGIDSAMIASLLPKSVTTAIATAISEQHGGIVSITIASTVVTGIFGNLAAPFLIKLFRVKDPLEAGVSISACSHAVGTAKAVEIGETEGAMSSLAIGLCGIITTVFALGFHLILQ